MAARSGWQGLFRDAFRRSRNAMVLLDDQRRTVDVNPAFLALLDRRRPALVGRPIREVVANGPLMTIGEWRVALAGDDFWGVAEMIRSDGRAVTVQFAGHPETATGQRLVLLVALSTKRPGRRLADQAEVAAPMEPLTRREQEVVALIGAGNTSPEIAEELQISHNTVRSHVFNAMIKLNARSRAHLVAKAMAGGYALR